MAQKEKLDLSSLPDNFRDDYEEIVHDLIRLQGKYNTLSEEIVRWLAEQILSPGPQGPARQAAEARSARVAFAMMMLVEALSGLSVPVVFDSQLEREQSR